MSKKMHLSNKNKALFVVSTLIMYLVSFAVKRIIPRKAFICGILLMLVTAIAAVVVVALLYKKGKISEKKNGQSNLLILLLVLVLIPVIHFIISSTDYHFVGKPFLPLWEIPLIISLVLAATITVKWLWKNTSLPARIGYFFLTLFLSFFISWCFVAHLNFALDFSTPETFSSVIYKKDIHRSGKTRYYEFKVQSGDELFDLDVDRFEYNRYDVGDIYYFQKYNGAFNLPFYISDPASN